MLAQLRKQKIENNDLLILEIPNCNKLKFCNILDLFKKNNIIFSNYYKEKKSYFILFDYNNIKQINKKTLYIIINIVLENE